MKYVITIHIRQNVLYLNINGAYRVLKNIPDIMDIKFAPYLLQLNNKERENDFPPFSLSLSPVSLNIIVSLAENLAPDPHHRRAFLNRKLIVVRHPH